VHFCLAPGCVDDVAQHRPDCPQTTGWYPVTTDDLDMCCIDCSDPFRIGETYVQRPESDFEEYRSLQMFEIVCVGCAALGCAS
jgi:hypothetical protein